MQFEGFSFGSIQIDGSTYEHDVVIDKGEVRKRKKNRQSDSETPSDIRLYRLKRRYLGSADALLSERGPEGCQLWTR